MGLSLVSFILRFDFIWIFIDRLLVGGHLNKFLRGLASSATAIKKKLNVLPTAGFT